MGATRIQEKSRVAKKVIGEATLDIFDDSIVYTRGKKPRADLKGFPANEGVPYPVLVGLTTVDSTP